MRLVCNLQLCLDVYLFFFGIMEIRPKTPPCDTQQVEQKIKSGHAERKARTQLRNMYKAEFFIERCKLNMRKEVLKQMNNKCA